MGSDELERAVVVGLSSSGWVSLLLAAMHPERVLGVVAIASWAPELLPWPAHRVVHDFDAVLDTDEGWAKENRHYWLRDWRGYAEFFFGELLRHRLNRYRAGRCLDYQDTAPDSLAEAIAGELTRPVSYRPVEPDGTERAAALIAELI